MITVGLIKEAFFIAHVLKQEVILHLRLGKESHPICITLSPDGLLKVFYKELHIWTENVESDTSFFGIESCDTISRILACIDNNTEWQSFAYHKQD